MNERRDKVYYPCFKASFCLGFSFICYVYYKKAQLKLNFVANLPLSTVEEIFTRLSPYSSEYVKICGKLHCSRPLKFKLNNDKIYDAAIIEKLLYSVEEYYSVPSSSWIRRDHLLASSNMNAKYSIKDPISTSGRVKNLISVAPESAEKFSSPITIQSFVEAEKPGFIKAILDSWRRVRLLGYMTLEKIIPVNADALAVGEVTKTLDGNIELHKPRDGKPFLLAFGKNQNILEGLSQTVIFRWRLAFVVILLGVAFTAYITFIWYKKWILKLKSVFTKQEKSDDELKREIEISEKIASVKPRNDNTDSFCVICKDKLSDIVLIPCGHFGFCNNCSIELNQCPICRVKITRRQKLFVV